MERCQNRQEMDVISLDTGRGWVFYSQKAVGAEGNRVMAHWKVASQASQAHLEGTSAWGWGREGRSVALG